MKMLRIMFAGLMLAAVSLSASAQVTFSLDTLEILPVTGSDTRCVQVGVYVDNQDATWNLISVRVAITDDEGILAGAPTLATFYNSSASLTSAGTAIGACPGGVRNVLNDTTNGNDPGVDPVALVAATNNPDLNDESVSATEVVFSAANLFNPFFTTSGRTLVAIIELPIAGDSGPGFIDLSFVDTVDDPNLIQGAGAAETPAFENGSVSAFTDADCGGTNFAVFTDNISGNMVTTNNPGDTPALSLDYIDPSLTGNTDTNGMSVDVSFDEAVVTGIQISGDDGFDTGIIDVSAETSPFNVDVPFADTGVAITYTVQYFVDDTLNTNGGNPIGGDTCSMTATVNAASCSANWINGGLGTGTNSELLVTITNPVNNGGGSFGSFTVPAGANDGNGANIGDFSIDLGELVDGPGANGLAANQATFRVVDAEVEADWAGDYNFDLEQIPSVIRGDGNISCSATLGFACATLDTVASGPSGIATMGQVLDINLAGTDEIGFEVVYNGITTMYPADTATAQITPVSTATTVLVRALSVSQDSSGNPCTDPEETYTLDFVAPVCGATSLDPPGSVDVGTVLTFELTTTGAVAASISGVPMAAINGTPGEDDEITWQANVTAIALSVTVVITNPDGETDECVVAIDLNCAPPTFVSVGNVGSTGITIAGTPGCTYYVKAFDKASGAQIGGTVVLDIPEGVRGIPATGTATDNTLVIPPDAIIEASLDPNFTVGTGQASTTTVPTLGEWALIAFAMLLMAAGVYTMRKRRIA